MMSGFDKLLDNGVALRDMRAIMAKALRMARLKHKTHLLQ